MSIQPGRNDDIYGLVELLSKQIERLEQVANETGVSIVDISKSKIVETMLLRGIAALRRIRNGERPLNKLPPEILGRIFSLVPAPRRRDRFHDLTRDFGPHALAPVADLLPLLSVCSLWRSVATSSSFLWSTIDNRDPRAFSIASEHRPTSGLLNAHIDDSFWQSPRRNDHLHWFREVNSTLLELLRNEGHRIREFYAEIRAVLLPDLMEFPGENLQTCQLRLVENPRPEDNLGEFRPLFSDCTPKLTSLLMEKLLFIPLNHFPSLTHLILGGLRHSTTTTEGLYSFSNFLLFLSRCPNLAVLHLYALDIACLHELPDGLIAAPLSLQRLRKFSNEEISLDQSGPPFQYPYFGPQFRRAILAHLQLSPDCIIRLATILPDDLGRTLHHIPFDAPLTSMYLSAYDPSSDTNGGNGVEQECFSIMATDPSRQRGIRIEFQMPSTRYVGITTESARAFVCAAVRGAPLLAAVHELWVIPTATVMLGEPYSPLGSLPHLTTLVLGLYPLDPDVPENIKCQWEPLRALEVRDDLVIPCPRLRTLCVYVTTEEHVIQLYAMLLSRGEAGYPVNRLVVGFYGPPQHSVLELAAGLSGLIEDFTLLRHWERCPEDLLWVHRLPFVCRDSSERNVYWPAWI